MPKYTVVKPFALPDGITAVAGRTVDLAPRQAKYLLLSGKLRPAKQGEPDTNRVKKPAADKEK